MEDVIRQYEREEGEAFSSTPETPITINVNSVGSSNTNQIDVRSVAGGSFQLIPDIPSSAGKLLYNCALYRAQRDHANA
jgi:hypothetical protein